ncbi:glycogen/starch/alpha-glucan phosphorylase [Telmatospirillum sp.]|uniref:glycogen/starch/alpha-glucan phosphorylase n=1 Tax=Telmatospirillum sp. TaxID=2079197 RepID=UPI00284BDC2A|nr:glycogen/starch/alpha-glucan phosphorylase [Telmatospirillum sp.]MDR3437752.1 glycogen/starch/alpha-glucan phosphorylase [Telmatospirillum sp.]
MLKTDDAPVTSTAINDVAAIKQSLADHLLYSVGKDVQLATSRDWYLATAFALRDRLISAWMRTMRSYYDNDVKRVYYLSMEFLIGRALSNGLINLGLYDAFREATESLGYDLDELQSWEVEPALGNGGLGRLAACLIDSMASLGMPGFGYGIRYEFGMFTQHVEQGWQVESPENWLRYGNPWEFQRPGVIYPVRFGGRVVRFRDADGRWSSQWVDAEEVMAMAYDVPVPGFGGRTVNNLRLWAAKSTREFNLKYFNQGNYIEAVRDKNESENLSKVLYPSDSTDRGKELRFRQEYFFLCASLQDILARFRKSHNNFDVLPDHVAIQLNDTHPAMTVAELMRVLLDEHHYEWDRAWTITVKTCGYTNHTLLPEALETWPVDLFERLLPRHLEIVYEINQRFLNGIRHRWPGDSDLLRRVSLIDEAGVRRVRMAHLAIVGSHCVNGVAEIHTDLMKSTIFADFERFQPGKITCKTNGVTPRRWLLAANPALAKLITAQIGDGWITHLEELHGLVPLAEDEDFRNQFSLAKRANKARLAQVIEQRLGVPIDTESLFDVMVKRMHEYKRQLLNVLHVVTRYNRIRANPTAFIVPRTVIIGGKAAPGYAMAKLILKLINDVADVVNNDPLVGDRLKVVFVPNYNVSTAELIIPGANLSEQISTAGTEASGTGNMKLALNGALTIGTWDGANVEICEEVGEENMFLFGLTAQEVARIRRDGWDNGAAIAGNTELAQVLDMIRSGYFSPEQHDRFLPIIDSLTVGGDHYLLTADYEAYIATQERVDRLYLDPEEWTRKAILNVARMGKFSSDRTVTEYGAEIWNVKV